MTNDCPTWSKEQINFIASRIKENEAIDEDKILVKTCPLCGGQLFMKQKTQKKWEGQCKRCKISFSYSENAKELLTILGNIK